MRIWAVLDLISLRGYVFRKGIPIQRNEGCITKAKVVVVSEAQSAE
jgi:hypothetical protein